MTDDTNETGSQDAEDEDRRADGTDPLGDLAEEIRDDDGTGSAEPPSASDEPGDPALDADSPDRDAPSIERDGPLSDIASEVDRTGDAEPAGRDLFDESEDVGDIDREALWRQVAGEELAQQIDDATTGGPEIDTDGPTVQRPDDGGSSGVTVEEREERVVEKAKYCQACEYFTGPPDVACTHDGTEIMEMVDLEHFRVANCPIVAEDEELENV